MLLSSSRPYLDRMRRHECKIQGFDHGYKPHPCACTLRESLQKKRGNEMDTESVGLVYLHVPSCNGTSLLSSGGGVKVIVAYLGCNGFLSDG